MVDEEELRNQLKEALKGADYPVSDAMELLPALPDGPSTRIESEDFSMNMLELNSKLEGDFPYEDVESLIDDIIEGLRESGYL